MAEARQPATELRRPWHGAPDSIENPGIVAIRLHRAEVEALMAFRRAVAGSEDQARLWRRLAALREKRIAMMPQGDAARLPALPAVPPGALSAWQKLRRRLGLSRG